MSNKTCACKPENFMKIWKKSLEKQPIRKIANISSSSISDFFASNLNLSKRMMWNNKSFWRIFTYFKVCG